MKYFIYFFCIVAYVAAEQKVQLQADQKPAKCECEDILNKILAGLSDSSKAIADIQAAIVKVKTEINVVEKELDDNTDKINEIDVDVDELESLININLKLVNQETFIINDIDVKVENLKNEQAQLKAIIDNNSCEINDIKDILLELQVCACTPKTTTVGDDDVTTPYYNRHSHA